MKVVGNFNKISDKLKSEIPVLKPDQIVTVEMLHGIPNPSPDEKEKRENPLLYGKRQIPTSDRIFDPYLTDSAGNVVGDYVDIGVIDSVDANGVPTYHFLFPGMGMQRFNGKFSLKGGAMPDTEIYEFLCLSNMNKGNKNRNSNVEPLFRFVDIVADSKNAIQKVDILRDALQKAANISDESAKEFSASLNWSETEILAIKGKVLVFAKDNPDNFLKVYNDPSTKIKASIKLAMDSGVIDYDIPTKTLKMGDTVLATIERSNDQLQSIYDWTQTAKNGKSTLESITNQLAKLKEEPELV